MKLRSVAVGFLISTVSVTSSVFAMTLKFNGFSESSNCAAMSLTQAALQNLTVKINLAAIKTTTSGLPTLTKVNGIELSSLPNFSFMGVEKEYAYISDPTTAAINLDGKSESLTMAYISFMSANKYSGYEGAMRLNDNNQNNCIVKLSQG